MVRKFIARQIVGFMPVVAVATLGFVAVFVAMTTLGWGAVEKPPASPSASPSAAASLATYTVPTPEPTDTPPPGVPLPSTRPGVLVGHRTAWGPNRLWRIDIRYPVFVAGTTPLADVINADIAAEVDTRVTIFESGPAAVLQTPGKLNLLTCYYSQDLLLPDLASFTMRWTDDTTVGEPVISVQTLDYTMDNGLRMDLGAIFADLPGALAIISVQSRDQLKLALGAAYDETVAGRGTAAVASSFRNWALTPSGLKITFAQYQVGGAAVGLPAVVIPWSMLKSVMLPYGPAAHLAGFPAAPAATGSSGSPGATQSSGVAEPTDEPTTDPAPSPGG
jgi:hypothetical protein